MRECRSVGHQPSGGSPPETKRRDDTDHGDQRGGRAYPDECSQVGLQPDVEQQDQHPDLGQNVQRRLAAHEGDSVFTEEGRQQVPRADPHEEFTEDRRLSPPFRHEPATLRRQHQERQSQEDRAGTGRRVGRLCPPADGNREEEKPPGSPPVPTSRRHWPDYAAG
jgi:hypothetical protein